ncbi:MADS-box domain-containing protein [Plasmodiophora brassicae]|uniref:MADS-box domain-containing protein n=2 Tax=Plasmodiophora brassicae TaxID=37360 RepID=A0A3P3YAG3_PLABS|nr:unnamed protein product [Plasmodiophora brassicae]
MGRKKIVIHRIDDQKNRAVTFNKRKVGLMKKAIELSVLCDCEVAVIVFHDNHLYQYSSEEPIDATLERYYMFEGPQDTIRNDDLEQLMPGKASSFKVGETTRKRARTSAVVRAVVYDDQNNSQQQQQQPPPPPPQRPIYHRPPPPPESSLLSKRNGPRQPLQVYIPEAPAHLPEVAVQEMGPPGGSNATPLFSPQAHYVSQTTSFMPSRIWTTTGQQSHLPPLMPDQHLNPWSQQPVTSPSPFGQPPSYPMPLATPTLSPFAPHATFAHGFASSAGGSPSYNTAAHEYPQLHHHHLPSAPAAQQYVSKQDAVDAGDEHHSYGTGVQEQHS